MSKAEQSTYGIPEELTKSIFVNTVNQEFSGQGADEAMADDIKEEIVSNMGWDEERTESVYDQIVDDSRVIFNNFGTDKCYKTQVDETRRVMGTALSSLEKRVDKLHSTVFGANTSEEFRERMEAAKDAAVEKVLADVKNTLFKK